MHHENVEASVGYIDNFVDFYCHMGTHERINCGNVKYLKLKSTKYRL